MSYVVSSLSNYTEQNEKQLVVKSLFDAKTQDLIKSEGNVMPRVKSAETINIMDTDAIFQTGGTCGFNASGSTTFTQRTLTVGKFKTHESICPKSLETKYLQKALSAGSQYDAPAYAADYSDLKAKTIAEQLETAIWQGDTSSVNVNLNKFDGLIKLIDAAGTATSGNTTSITSGTGITASNVRTIVNNMWKALPTRVKGKKDVRIFCGWDVYELYIGALIEANLYAYTANNDAQGNGEITIPGTQYKLTAVHGLNSTNRLFALRTSNLYLGVDLDGEEERFEIFFAKEADEVRFMAEWKMGVQVAFPSEIVQFTLA